MASFIALTFSLLLRLFNLTFRYQLIGKEEMLEEVRSRIDADSFILASWHQNTILGLLSNRNYPLVAMVSRSKDGELIARFNSFMGFRSVRGSSSRGGREAKKELIDILKDRSGVGAITIDGPRGPSHVPKAGVIDIARQSGVPIIPLIPVAKRNWIFTKSWDRFRMPKPFNKVYIFYGKPIWIAEDTPYEDFDKYKSQLKGELERMEARLVEEFKLQLEDNHG